MEMGDFIKEKIVAEMKKEEKKKMHPKTFEKAPALDLSPEERELFELQKAHWDKIKAINLPAFDPKIGIWDILKMGVKSWGEILSPRGIKLMLNEARLNQLNAKYWDSKECLSEYRDLKKQGEQRSSVEQEISAAQEEVKLAQDKLGELQEKLLKLVEEQQNKK